MTDSQNGSTAQVVQAAPKGLTAQEIKTFEEVRRMLEGATGDLITGDEVQHHTDPNRKDMIFPQDMTWAKAQSVLSRKQKEESKVTEFNQTFDYRYEDGLVAAARVMRAMFGMTIGKTLQTFFGDIPPAMRTVKTGVNTSIQVPEGRVEIPSLTDTVIFLGSNRNRRLGNVFHINIEGPNKYRKIYDKLFSEVAEELKNNSIYRGKILSGANDLDYVDLRKFDPSKLVFSEEVNDVLENAILSRIEKTELLRNEGIPIKTATLLHGPFGTGKSSIGSLIAQRAEKQDWTFLFAKAGHDKIEEVLGIAQMYAPAVVFVEDVDIQGNNGDPQAVSRMLDALDNATNKNSEIIFVATSNYIERIQKGMLRPGRLDFVLRIGSLDRPGVEKLFKVVVGEAKLDKAIDYDAVWEQMEGFEPAFVKSTADRAKTWALARTGNSNYVLTTEDLVGAAKSLHAQQKLHEEAGEGERLPTLDVAVDRVVANVINRSGMHGSDKPQFAYEFETLDPSENDS